MIRPSGKVKFGEKKEIVFKNKKIQVEKVQKDANIVIIAQETIVPSVPSVKVNDSSDINVEIGHDEEVINVEEFNKITSDEDALENKIIMFEENSSQGKLQKKITEGIKVPLNPMRSFGFYLPKTPPPPRPSP
jgi:hypothetical protein